MGGNGSDTLSGGSGLDTLDGGENGDTYEVLGNQAEFDSFQDTGASGIDILRNTAAGVLTLSGFTATNGIEAINGNNQAIIGNNNSNFFNFSVVSFTNVSYVDAGSSGDEIIGTAAGDNLRGNGGNDTIAGGAGADNLFGGAGNDAFIFNNANEGIDTINDFNLSNDKLNISSAGFGGTAVVGAVGALAAARFTTGTAATNATQRFIYNNLSGALYFDADGTGSSSQIQIAALVTRPNLNSSGFSII